MEIAIFVGVIFIALNVWVLIELAVRLSDVKNEIDRVKHMQEIMNRNVFAVREDMRNVESQIAEELTPDVEDLTPNELARLARQREFDKRIADLRAELGYDTYGTHAEEAHPDVKNLPHNIIPTSLYDLPDVEIAE